MWPARRQVAAGVSLAGASRGTTTMTVMTLPRHRQLLTFALLPNLDLTGCTYAPSNSSRPGVTERRRENRKENRAREITNAHLIASPTPPSLWLKVILVSAEAICPERLSDHQHGCPRPILPAADDHGESAADPRDLPGRARYTVAFAAHTAIVGDLDLSLRVWSGRSRVQLRTLPRPGSADAGHLLRRRRQPAGENADRC